MSRNENTRLSSETQAGEGSKTPESNHEYDSKKKGGKQHQISDYLLCAVDGESTLRNICPSAKSLCGFSRRLKRWCVIQIRCKRWGCRYCGERKISRFAWRCEDAKPNRLITLTVATSDWTNPRAAYESTKAAITRLAVKLRRRYGEFEYFRVLEVTKKGWPHYHLIVRSEYIPQKVIKEMWCDLTGATIVDVRQIKKGKGVYYYVLKYLAKQHVIPWTNRRLAWSKGFFRDQKFEAAEPLDLIEIGWIDEPPLTVIHRYYHPFRINELSPDCYTFEEWQGSQIGIPMNQKYGKRRKATK